jgi:hypothetical protein
MKYAYVYSQVTANNKRIYILSMQKTISQYIKHLIDPIEITSIRTDFAQKYDVVCIDYYAINENFINISTLRPYLEIIKKCRHIALLLRDLHEWTFTSDPTVEQSAIANPLEIYKPTNTIGSGYRKFKSFIETYNIKHLISIYACAEFNNLISYTKCKSYIIPLHIDTKIYHDLKLVKDIDVLIYGADNYKVYPLRNRIKNVIKTMSIKYHILAPSSVCNPDRCDTGLSKLLNRSWLTLCTCSVFDYLVLKYFEASACGSVIVGNMSSQGRSIWGVNYVNIPMGSTNEQIMAIITQALSDKTKLINMSKTMQQKILFEYNYGQYATKLNNICNKISSI